MGLKVSTIARLPIATDRDFFIYFLDYGWEEPLSRAMYDNFERMAEFAAENRSLVIAGLSRQEFANEVLSWHRVNGQDADSLLPAVMITDCDPRLLGESGAIPFGRGDVSVGRAVPDRFLLIPLKEVCKSATDVAVLLQRIMSDIKSKKSLSDFSVREIINRSNEGLSEMFVLRPSIAGMGVDLKKVWEAGSKYIKGRRKSKPNQ